MARSRFDNPDVFCKGSFILGTACNNCARCTRELALILGTYNKQSIALRQIAEMRINTLTDINTAQRIAREAVKE